VVHDLPSGAARPPIKGWFFGWRSDDRLLYVRYPAPIEAQLVERALDGSDERIVLSLPQYDRVVFTPWNHSADRSRWVLAHGYYRSYGNDYTLRVLDLSDPANSRSLNIGHGPCFPLVTEDGRVAWPGG